MTEYEPVCLFSETDGAHWFDRVSYLSAQSVLAAQTQPLEDLFQIEREVPTQAAAAPEERVNLPSELLADKWRPRLYTQLLSAEKWNLQIMQYFASFAKKPESDEPWVLVLNGPPGVGKSTLCGVIARHWGYSPVEINASRERTESQFMQTVINVRRSATAKSGIGAAPTKNCLIVEELDGISPQGVAALLKALTGETRACPVICITNDLYVSQLRAFRQHPKVRAMTIPPIDDARMLLRLEQIASEENIYPDMSPERLQVVLKHIASHASGDIRVALNLLQMAHIPRGATTAPRATGGIDGKSPFGVWEFLLSKHRPLLHQTTQYSVPVLNLLEQLKRCPNSQRIADGLYTNFLTALGITAFHFHSGRSVRRCAHMWSTVDNASGRFSAAGDVLQRIAMLRVHMAVQTDGVHIANRQYEWPRQFSQKFTETFRGQCVLEFTHTFARTFGGVLSIENAVLDYIPSIMACTVAVDSLLNEAVAYDYTRLALDKQATVEHVAGILRRYGLLRAPKAGGASRRTVFGSVLSAATWEALADVAEYCVVESKGVFAHSPRKQRKVRKHTDEYHAQSESMQQRLYSLRSIMRDAPKLPTSKAAAAAERNRRDAFAKFKVPKGQEPSKPQRRKMVELPDGIKVRYKAYKYSTSKVIRPAIVEDFLPV